MMFSFVKFGSVLRGPLCHLARSNRIAVEKEMDACTFVLRFARVPNYVIERLEGC
jgi:hypothetical protein